MLAIMIPTKERNKKNIEVNVISWLYVDIKNENDSQVIPPPIINKVNIFKSIDKNFPVTFRFFEW